jgi:Txe/YoeB family toxin of Txe-Axe toxin-antitoxin module
MINEAKNKYSNNSVNLIIEAISRELLDNQESLVDMAIKNSDTFSREINDIVKNTLIYEIKTKIKDTSNDIVDDFSLELKDLSNNLSNFNFDDEWIEKISTSTKDVLEKAQNGMNTILKNREKIPIEIQHIKQSLLFLD